MQISAKATMKISYSAISVRTAPRVATHDITPRIKELIRDAAITDGFVVVSSRHTTTALAINENEERLLEDIKSFLERLIPPDNKYLHNDIHLRDCPPDEPENAHSHIAAMLLGSSEAIPVEGGELALGQWQSVMLFELDGPRDRTVNVQVIGE